MTPLRKKMLGYKRRNQRFHARIKRLKTRLVTSRSVPLFVKIQEAFGVALCAMAIGDQSVATN